MKNLQSDQKANQKSIRAQEETSIRAEIDITLNNIISFITNDNHSKESDGYVDLDDQGNEQTKEILLVKNLVKIFQNQRYIEAMTEQQLATCIEHKIFNRFAKIFEKHAHLPFIHFLVSNHKLLEIYLDNYPHEVNKKAKLDDSTPIFNAVDFNRPESFKVLKNAGANFYETNTAGDTVAHLAIKNHKPDRGRSKAQMIEMLSQINPWLFDAKNKNSKHTPLSLTNTMLGDSKETVHRIIATGHIKEIAQYAKLLGCLAVTSLNAYLIKPSIPTVLSPGVIGGALKGGWSYISSKKLTSSTLGDIAMACAVGVTGSVAAIYSPLASVLAYNLGALACTGIATVSTGACYLKCKLSKESFAIIAPAITSIIKTSVVENLSHSIARITNAIPSFETAQDIARG